MTFLNEAMISDIKKKLSDMKDPVKILFFKPKDGCQFCDQIEQIASEVKNINPKLSAEIIIFDPNNPLAKEYEVDAAPVIVLRGKEKCFVRFYGLPTGYEFPTFISDILDVSKGAPSIDPSLAENIKKIDFPVHMRVFVTPTCPYCAGAVKVAHDFALLNPNIKGDMVESMEFRDLAEKYNVMGVPKTVINDKIELAGAYPADIVLKKILELKK